MIGLKSLSPIELELISNTDWILTKNEILKKVNHFLAQFNNKQIEIIREELEYLPSEVPKSTAKISKGENYRGLPYMVLDYPRLFLKGNSFAIRTLFWWGHFFSCTLHLSGNYKTQFQSEIISGYPVLKKEGFFVCVNDNEWEHHFEEDNYVAIQNLTANQFERQVLKASFVKIAINIPLKKWNDAEHLLSEQFSRLIKVLVS